MARPEEGEPNQAGAGTGIEDMRVGRQVGRPDQAIQGRGVGLHGGLLESRGLAVEGLGKVPIMGIARGRDMA